MSKHYAITPKKYLSPSELLLVRRLVEGKKDRDSLIVRLALATGARASELLEIMVQDLNVDDRTVFINGLKESNDREIPISENLFLDLLALAGPGAKPDDKLFNIGYQRLYQVWNEMRPCPKKFHSLRHTFAIELYKKTRDLKIVQTTLGHRNIQNTMVYADYVFGKEEMRKALLG